MDPNLTLYLYKKWVEINIWADSLAYKPKERNPKNKYCLKNTDRNDYVSTLLLYFLIVCTNQAR